MKHNGQTLQNSVTITFLLPRGNSDSLPLRLQPLSLGFHQRLRSRGILPPVPPARIARDSSGKPLKDSQGLLIHLTDLQDKDYLAASQVYHQRVAVLSVAEALQCDPQVSFETSIPRGDQAQEWQHYADQLFQEMEEAGFAAGDLIVLCREICRLSNLLDDHLQAARQNFSSTLPAPPG